MYQSCEILHLDHFRDIIPALEGIVQIEFSSVTPAAPAIHCLMFTFEVPCMPSRAATVGKESIVPLERWIGIV